MELNDVKLKILRRLKHPKTVKMLKSETGLTWSNLSKQLQSLKKDGFVLDVGKEGKSKVMLINSHTVSKYLQDKIEDVQRIKEELVAHDI